jgi:hypothetical protein
VSKNGKAASPVVPNDLYLLDIPEVARRLSTTIYAVRSLIRKGKLKYISCAGHAMLISPSGIQEFIQANEIYYND